MRVNVTNQSELDSAIVAGNKPQITSDADFDISKAPTVLIYGSSQPRVVCSGSSQPRVVCYDSSQPRVVCYGSSEPRVECSDSSQPRVVCSGSSQPRVECYGSSEPRVECYGSSQPRVECYDSSQPRVECSGSSQPRVGCYGSSEPRVECYDNAQLAITGKASVKAGPKNPITTDGKSDIDGGVIFQIGPIKTPEEWCAAYRVPVVGGVAILFKAVDSNFKANQNGFDYTPGTTPVAPDWDGGKEECGGGLHFSPRPSEALAFNTGAKKFVACPVNLADIAVHPNPQWPSKVKAKGCCAAVWECDIDGEKVET
jgi:hypothetical protein